MSFVVMRTFVALALYGDAPDIHADLGGPRRQWRRHDVGGQGPVGPGQQRQREQRARGLPLIMGVHESLLSGGQKEKVSNNTISTNSKNGDGFGP
jgi:hypothetical protein